MLNIKNILYLGFVLLLTSCSGDDIMTGNSLDGNGYDPVGTPILFSVGLQDKAITRTDPTSMAGSHFVCTMYYHSNKNDNNYSAFDLTDGKITKAWLEVSDDAGNATYKNEAFSAASTPFYWQNRLNHAFVAIANYHDLTTSQTIYQSMSDARHNTYDLTKGTKASITDQPDPIRAVEIQDPSDDTPANNSVTLNFQHQFSQIQVNVKNAEGTNITSDQITGVELLGVSKTGYVYTKLNDDGTVDPPAASVIDLDIFNDEELATNKWGTSFEMFPTTLADGYLKSFNAIAFGTLRAIRVTWSDGTEHKATLEVQQTLASGKMYTYNLSIQHPTAGTRGLLNNKLQTSELVLDGDVSITNWPVKNR